MGEGSGIPESRFAMWRAVVALAHLDGRIDPAERSLVEGYLAHVPFSPDQAEALGADLAHPRDPAEAFDAITDPADRGEFFAFAQAMVACDHDLDPQEMGAVEALQAGQLAQVQGQDLPGLLHAMREKAASARAAEDQTLREEARKALGLGAFLRGMLRRQGR
ncbi:MAG TPA: hypothetical protein DDX54_01185 [Rhodospirillaceae bacterium]|nr:DUF533 domain-containing protein [Alphaproteobacteria bacterium]HBH26008.1 hypothetical protein [Rhodospirillaceae bacterium]